MIFECCRYPDSRCLRFFLLHLAYNAATAGSASWIFGRSAALPASLHAHVGQAAAESWRFRTVQHLSLCPLPLRMWQSLGAGGAWEALMLLCSFTSDTISQNEVAKGPAIAAR